MSLKNSYKIKNLIILFVVYVKFGSFFSAIGNLLNSFLALVVD